MSAKSHLASFPFVVFAKILLIYKADHISGAGFVIVTKSANKYQLLQKYLFISDTFIRKYCIRSVKITWTFILKEVCVLVGQHIYKYFCAFVSLSRFRLVSNYYNWLFHSFSTKPVPPL